jgi:hypothetical protein
MRTTLLMVIFLVFSVSGLLAQNSMDSMTVKNLSQLQWQPKKALPPGAFSAAVYGDPAKGNYDFYAKFPANFTVPMHWHSYDCTVIILKGSMTIKRDGLPDRKIEQYGFFTLPGKMKYVAYCSQECLFLAHGIQPFDIFYQNPKDDPRTGSDH